MAEGAGSQPALLTVQLDGQLVLSGDERRRHAQQQHHSYGVHGEAEGETERRLWLTLGTR